MPRFDAEDLGNWEQEVATLAGSLVHEVKNPLSTLNIITQLLLEEIARPSTPREERMTKRLQVMKEEIARIEHIVTSFLRFTREQKIDRAPGDLNEIVQQLLDDNQVRFDRTKIRVLFHPGELPPALLNSFRHIPSQ